MNRYRLLFSIILLLFFSPCLRAGEWQWSVTLDGFVSNETNRNPTAFLWIPADCMQIKAIIVGQHNMSEETLFDNPLFREKMQKLGIGFVWITPGIDQQWDVSKGTQQIFEKMMVSLADVSGYSELKNVPIVPIGHSAMATYPGTSQHGIRNALWLSFPCMAMLRVRILPATGVRIWNGDVPVI